MKTLILDDVNESFEVIFNDEKGNKIILTDRKNPEYP